jgi:hypothetical protein
MLSKRDAADIDKLAVYWRMSPFMAEISRTYDTLFSRISLQTLVPYGAQRASPAAPSAVHSPRAQPRYKCHVHAEVQIVVHYLLHSSPASRSQTCLALLPRCIGCSKAACYLCDAFLRHTGRFSVSRSHGRLFERWTVPDLSRYTDAQRDELSAVLRGMVADMQLELASKGGAAKGRQHPNQSTLKVFLGELRRASKATLASLLSRRSPASSSTATVAPSRHARGAASHETVKTEVQPRTGRNTPVITTEVSTPTSAITEHIVASLITDCDIGDESGSREKRCSSPADVESPSIPSDASNLSQTTVSRDFFAEIDMIASASSRAPPRDCVYGVHWPSDSVSATNRSSHDLLADNPSATTSLMTSISLPTYTSKISDLPAHDGQSGAYHFSPASPHILPLEPNSGIRTYLGKRGPIFVRTPRLHLAIDVAADENSENKPSRTPIAQHRSLRVERWSTMEPLRGVVTDSSTRNRGSAVVQISRHNSPRVTIVDVNRMIPGEEQTVERGKQRELLLIFRHPAQEDVLALTLETQYGKDSKGSQVVYW